MVLHKKPGEFDPISPSIPPIHEQTAHRYKLSDATGASA